MVATLSTTKMAAGLADAGPGILAAARALDLDFLPLATERYDLVFAEETRASAPVAALLDTLPGYDIAHTGTVVFDGLIQH